MNRAAASVATWTVCYKVHYHTAQKRQGNAH